jgi:hypothetical protein
MASGNLDTVVRELQLLRVQAGPDAGPVAQCRQARAGLSGRGLPARKSSCRGDGWNGRCVGSSTPCGETRSEAEFTGEHRSSLARSLRLERGPRSPPRTASPCSALWLVGIPHASWSIRVSVAKVRIGLTVSLTYATRAPDSPVGSGSQSAVPRLWVFSQSSSAETRGLQPRSPSHQSLPARHVSPRPRPARARSQRSQHQRLQLSRRSPLRRELRRKR